MTPSRIVLPGEAAKRAIQPPSPKSHRWSTDLSTKARSIRTRATSMSFRRLSTGTSRPSKASNNEGDCLLEQDITLAVPQLAHT
ncbi:hypothetical protein FA15DRAFT_699998 [Coprinopsis marcescibilis]|uniref:Uncharacterized protein n=1 Tax=Coprinopsis marcescibilis TaxID=230819 RepID=A0A5C3LA80_COPMA|nr:hypothetical protein FA15DRAFT_699998 [Coprinopsis marcescibilis]